VESYSGAGFVSSGFMEPVSPHTVTFDPGLELPQFIVPLPGDHGPPTLQLNASVLFPQKPAGEFDGRELWNSGLMDIEPGAPGGTAFSMSFSNAGNYNYVCALHVAIGMVGSVNVTERTNSTVAQLNPLGGEFPEGLAVGKDGTIYAGMAPTGEIKAFDPSGGSSTYARLPAPGAGFMLGMEFDDARNLYVAMSSIDPATHGIWRVPPGGGEGKLFAALPVEGFPNVMIVGASGELYVSDTIGGAIWKIDEPGNVSDWAADPLMAGNLPPGPLGFPIGANGIVFDSGEENLYVTVTDKNRIVRIPVNADGSAGTAELFVEDANLLGGPDGLTIDRSGNLYAALFGSDAVAKISPNGAITTLAQVGKLQNPSDVKFGLGANAGTLYVANFAAARLLGLVPGNPNPAAHCRSSRRV
jgi:sugar lactone lactonase YvrE/plastocyanin